MENEDTQELNVTEIMRELDRRQDQFLEDLKSYLSYAVEHRASDLFIVAGGPVSVKIDGRISAVGDGKVLPPPDRGADYPDLPAGRPLHVRIPVPGGR